MFFLQIKTINKQTMLKDFPQENLRLCTQNSNSVEKLTSKEQTTNYLLKTPIMLKNLSQKKKQQILYTKHGERPKSIIK